MSESSTPTPFKHRCAFCDEPAKLTKEHLWSKWTRKHLTYDSQKHQRAFVVWDDEGTTERRRTYGGDARNSGPEAVCRVCNGGWMSSLEVAARPFLLPLIRGEKAIIGVDGQKVVATWIAMKTMVSEYFDLEHIAVPLEERQYLRDNLRPPDNWRIWIGSYDREKWAGQWLHGAAGVHSIHTPPRNPDGPNTQATTFVVGRLYSNVFSSEVRHLVNCISLGEIGMRKLAQIWPIQGQLVAWPITPLDDTDADMCATALHDGLREMFRTGPSA